MGLFNSLVFCLSPATCLSRSNTEVYSPFNRSNTSRLFLNSSFLFSSCARSSLESFSSFFWAASCCFSELFLTSHQLPHLTFVEGDLLVASFLLGFLFIVLLFSR